MNFGVLRMFSVLAKTLNYTEAAQALHVSQSTLSRKIQQLENDIKIKLFHRGGNSIHLTPQGLEFLISSNQIIAQMDMTLERLNDSPQSLRGDIKIGLLHPMARWLSKGFLKIFTQRHPHLKIQLVTLHPSQLKKMMDCDLMISPFLPLDQSLIAKPINKFERYFYASKGYLEEHGTPATPHDLALHNCITNNTSMETESVWTWCDRESEESKVEENKVAISGTVSTDSVDIAMSLTFDGFGVGLLPATQARLFNKDNTLVNIFNSRYFQYGRLYAVYRSREYMPSRFSTFIEELQEFFEKQANDTAATSLS